MLSCRLTRLTLAVGVVVCFSVTTLTERRLLCSSDSLTVWGEYEGPVHHFSLSVESCSNGMDVVNANYTLITKFTIARAGYHIAIYYKNQLWVEQSLPQMPCRDLKLCHIIKGETLRESLSIRIKPYYAAEGEYRLHVIFNIIDDQEREIIVTLNVTLLVRNRSDELISSTT